MLFWISVQSDIESRLTFSHVHIQLTQYNVIKRTCFQNSTTGSFCHKSNNHICVGLLLDLSSIPLVYLSIFAAIYFLYYYRVRINLVTWPCESSRFVLPQDYLVYSSFLLHFYTNLKIKLLFSLSKENSIYQNKN